MDRNSNVNNGRKYFFGKYKGQYIKDIIVRDTQYVTWTMKNVHWLWYNNEEVELYKKQIVGYKPKNQYEMIMDNIRYEQEHGVGNHQGKTP